MDALDKAEILEQLEFQSESLTGALEVTQQQLMRVSEQRLKLDAQVITLKPHWDKHPDDEGVKEKIQIYNQQCHNLDELTESTNKVVEDLTVKLAQINKGIEEL